jgi:glycosyltransferase involved in cell wall biosynthesis
MSDVTKKDFALHWAAVYQWDAGSYFGYSVFIAKLREYVSQLIELNDAAPVALTIASGDKFRPVPGKKNFCFSMFETPDLPRVYIEHLGKADELIVPCQWLKEVFERHFPGKKVHWCWLGTDPEVFTFKERKLPFAEGKRFRYLWLGAATPRKGYELVNRFAEVIAGLPQFELYLKTTVPKKLSGDEFTNWLGTNWKALVERYGEHDADRIIREMLDREDISGKIHTSGEHGNVIVDTRVLNEKELAELYHSAHCFLLPTLAEGFGLTLCEAMATGLPCVATSVTGTKDFFDPEVGYTIKYEWQDDHLRIYDLHTVFAMPDVNDFVMQAVEVAQQYPRALKKGERAAERIRGKFTWPIAAQRLVDIIRGQDD